MINVRWYTKFLNVQLEHRLLCCNIQDSHSLICTDAKNKNKKGGGGGGGGGGG